MVKLTKLLCVLVLCLFGIASANAKVEKVHATFESPTNTNTTWTPDASEVTKGTFTWSTTYYNQLRNIGLPTGDITKYKKLVVDTEIKSGEQFRILIYKGGSNLTLYASNGVNEFILADTLKVLYPDTYNEFLLDCSEICLSGNNNAAPGEAIIKDVYLETYNDEGEKVFATFEEPSNTNTTWTPDASEETKGTFTWSTTYYNQLRNIGLPSGDISMYKKLVVDTEIKSGNQFRILIYKGGSNLTLYASNGLNEFILADTLKVLYPDTYNEFLLDCTEICLSGNNNAAPGEAVIKSVYLETYPENEQVDIPDIVYEEDPGKPAGDFVDFTEAFPDLQPRIGLGTDGHPIVLGNGDVVVGQRSKNVIADLSAYSKLTMVTSPNLKLVLYMNHEIDAKQNAGDYTGDEAGKYVFMDVQADENGIIEVDLTQFDKQDLNCIALPWDNNNKGTVWYILLTAKGDVPVQNTYTAKFENNGNWAEVYAYAWSGKEGEEGYKLFLGDWPGAKINATEEGYVVTIEAEEAPEYIIFSNGAGIQTEDLAFENGKTYTFGEPQPELNTYTVKFENNGNWAEVYAYAWTTVGEGEQAVTTKFLGDWPGTLINATEEGYVVTIEAEEAPAFIIFNNGADIQTGDLAFENGKTYTYGAPSSEDAALKEAPEGWTLVINNGNLAGDDVSSYFAKEYPSSEVKGATIVAGAGKDNSRGIVVKAGDDTANESSTAWDSQFWIVLNESLPKGTKVHVEFDYKASQAATASTQSHGAQCNYIHWACMGNVDFTTEWQTFSTEFTVADEADGMQSIAFNLQEEKSATDYYFDNFGVWYQKPAVIDDWTDIVVNGDMEGESTECFYVTEQGIGGPFLANITEGIGVDGSKAVKVESYDDPSADWDSQFFIRLPYQIPAGTKYKVSFDYKADKAGDFDTQAHTEPGGYIHWACIGSGSFTTAWQSYSAEGTISDEMSKEGQLMQTIAFNLAKNKVATQFVFDNVKFLVPSDVVPTLTLNPAQDPKPYTKPVFNSMAIVGDFLGLEATEEDTTPNWNPANGWQMTQDAENDAVWTLVKDEFTAEAKTYEYKAVANGNWDDYVLPKEDNQNYNFDTPNLGAGKYKLTFTADTRKHSVNLDVEKLDVTTYTATFTTDAEWEEVYAYAWSGKEGEEGFKKFLGDWPGTKLEAVEGVYTVSIQATDAPEMIVFNNGNGGEGNQTADLKFENGGTYEYKKPTGEEAPVKLAPEGWTLATTNGNLAGDDASSYVMKEYPSTDIVPAAIEAGAGTEGSRGIVVKAGDAPENADAWASQFWIQLAEAVPAGTKVHVEFDYKASQAAKASTQAHNTPGAYQHWGMIGDVNFTTEWQTFSADIEVNDAMAGNKVEDGVVTEVGPGLLTIAFNLQEEKSATDYYFDNFGVWYQLPEPPLVIENMAIVGDFLGLEATEEDTNPNWNPANGWAMEQDTENSAVWTLTKDFTAEAKTYEYKATANGKWGDYELPAEGNKDFTFGTDEYPAGDYKLVFTADTENNTLDLVVKPSTIQTFTATFTTNAYWWNDVYAYAWSGEGENVTEYLGAWPGTKMKVNDGVYTVNIEGEVAPEMIVFSNGNTGEGNQTEDLAFEDGKAYQYVFNPTFDFENNSGNWADGTSFVDNPITTEDGITLTGVSGVTYKEGKLILNKGSFKLTAPEGKSIVKVELKVLALASDKTDPTTEVGELVKTMEKVKADETIDYAILTWTGQEAELTFTASARGRNLGFINVTTEDVVEPIISDGTYYVMNAAEGTLINAEGALDAKGALMTFTFDKANNAYTIEGADYFTGKQWTVANAIEGISGYYTISTAEGFLAASATNTLEQIADDTADAAVWILLEKAYWEDIVNSTYTVAGTKNLTGTENDWDVAEANQMVLNEETGLFEKKFKRIAINAENQPEFKVVQTNMEGESIWYPASEEGNDHNWVITTDYVGGEGLYDITITFDASDFKEISVIPEKRIVFPENAIVYDFEAAAEADENPGNKNGSAGNGQAFYGWENPEKTDSKRQDYKGYEWAEGSVLPEECHVWRRSDRINGNVAGNGGLKCPSNKEMAIDGLNPGDKVIIVYDAENATDKEIIWAIGDGTSDGGPGVVRATATINGVEAVTGETTIASGAEIVVNSVTPAENGTGYIVFQVKKGMVIQQIAVIPAEPVAPLYVIGDGNSWDRTNMEELAFDETTGIYKYEIVTNSDFFFAFADKQMTAEEAEADSNWATFNSTYRYAIDAGDQTPTLDTEYQLKKVNGTIKLAAGKYNVYVTKDMKMTIKDATTDGINFVTIDTQNAVIYNMNGQKVQNVRKGLYIINGKKQVVK